MDQDQLNILKERINDTINQWGRQQPTISFNTPVLEGETAPEEPKRELPKDKRVIRTKSTGDRVYLIDEVAKTRTWVTSAEILEKLGFTMADVQEVEDSELVGYAMTASVYRVED